MDLHFNLDLATGYKSLSQKCRVLTEAWVHQEVFCPACGSAIKPYPRNNPAADFFCPNCSEIFELKSKHGSIGRKIVDGAYRSLMERLNGNRNPNLFLLSYDVNSSEVVNFVVVPKYFFVPSMIEERPPLSPTSRRAGWVGCNIIIGVVPEAGRIHYVTDRSINPKQSVRNMWQQTAFLGGASGVKRGWLIDIIGCVERIPSDEFYLEDIYRFESELAVKHPDNTHIKDKIRQQLQVLRDKGYLTFLGRGRYRKN